MKVMLFVAVLAAGVSSKATAESGSQSGAQQFVSKYAKLPKSYDAAIFDGKAVKAYGGCQLSMTGGYLFDGIKYLQLSNDLGETVSVVIDSKKNFPGNVIEVSQRGEEADEFATYPVVYKLKIQVDNQGTPLRAQGKIDRKFPYADSKIDCANFSVRSSCGHSNVDFVVDQIE